MRASCGPRRRSTLRSLPFPSPCVHAIGCELRTALTSTVNMVTVTNARAVMISVSNLIFATSFLDRALSPGLLPASLGGIAGRPGASATGSALERAEDDSPRGVERCGWGATYLTRPTSIRYVVGLRGSPAAGAELGKTAFSMCHFTVSLLRLSSVVIRLLGRPAASNGSTSFSLGVRLPLPA